MNGCHHYSVVVCTIIYPVECLVSSLAFSCDIVLEPNFFMIVIFVEIGSSLRHLRGLLVNNTFYTNMFKLVRTPPSKV